MSTLGGKRNVNDCQWYLGGQNRCDDPSHFAPSQVTQGAAEKHGHQQPDTGRRRNRADDSRQTQVCFGCQTVLKG